MIGKGVVFLTLPSLILITISFRSFHGEYLCTESGVIFTYEYEPSVFRVNISSLGPGKAANKAWCPYMLSSVRLGRQLSV